jgi:hypothetical protein
VDQQEFERRAMAAARDHAVWVRRNLAQVSADLDAADAALRGEGYGSRSPEPAGELGEDRQIGVQPNPIQTTDAEGSKRLLGLEAPELALYGSAPTVESREAGSVARDQRV